MNQYFKPFFPISFLFIIFFALFVNNVYAANSIIKSVEEFKFKQAAGFDNREPYSQVWATKDNTYLVWVDPKFRPMITQITNGKVTTVPLDQQPDYITQEDGHHRYSIGVDKNGYIHVTGDMHGYTIQTTGVVHPYPLRYQKKLILYWRSNKPNDVTGGFSFMGGNAATAIPGGGWLQGFFFADNNGELYYTSQIHAFESTAVHAQMCVGLYKYDLTNKTWSAIGGNVPPPVNPSTIYQYYSCLYWENAGFKFSNGWFQNLQPAFRFDSKNRLHFAVSANTNSNYDIANTLIYAYTDDLGKTWKRANGSLISGFPIRGISGLSNSGDIVENNNTTGYNPTMGLTMDLNGKVGVAVNNLWRVWNGSAWITNTPQNAPATDLKILIPTTGFRLPNNTLFFNALFYQKMAFANNFDSQPMGFDPPLSYKSFRNVHDYALNQLGVVYGLGTLDDLSETILKTSITPAPLPTGWSALDIDTVKTGYAGNSGYLNGSFTIYSYGISISDDQDPDSLHYVYQKMSGDGTITARVSTMHYLSAGVMMRKDLTPNSPQAVVFLRDNTPALQYRDQK